VDTRVQGFSLFTILGISHLFSESCSENDKNVFHFGPFAHFLALSKKWIFSGKISKFLAVSKPVLKYQPLNYDYYLKGTKTIKSPT
jgi:hypothetical protein